MILLKNSLKLYDHPYLFVWCGLHDCSVNLTSGSCLLIQMASWLIISEHKHWQPAASWDLATFSLREEIISSHLEWFSKKYLMIVVVISGMILASCYRYFWWRFWGSCGCFCSFNTLKPRQNGCYFADNIFKMHFLEWKRFKFQLKFHKSLFLMVHLTIFQHWLR